MGQSENLQGEPISTKETSLTAEIKQKNWWKIGFFVLAILLLIVSVGFAYFLVNTKCKEEKRLQVSFPTLTVTPTPSAQLTPESILGEIKNHLSKNFSVSEINDGNLEWLRDDNYAAPIKGKELLVYNKIEEFADINREIESFFTLADFIKNEPNSHSYDIFDGKLPVNRAAFENQKMKCVAKWRKEGFSDFRGEYLASYIISCGLYDQQSDPVNEILPALEPGQGYDLSKKINNYAYGGGFVFPCCTGWSWIAVKKDDQWKVVFKGQESPMCEIVDKYKIPQGIYKNCYEDISGKLRFESP